MKFFSAADNYTKTAFTFPYFLKRGEHALSYNINYFFCLLAALPKFKEAVQLII